MEKHREEYEKVRDGAITYFRKEDTNSNLIEMYGKSEDLNKRMRIVAIVKQKDENKEVFLNSMEEFEELREKIEKKSKDRKVETKDRDENEKEIVVSEETNDDSNEDTSESVEENIKELENKALALEAIGAGLINDLESINALKNSMMTESINFGVILEERRAYEQAQDKLSFTTAKYMVQKNILVAKRETVILDINRAINTGKDVSSLSTELVELNNQVENLDATYNQEFPMLQAEVSSAYQSLQNTSKEVTKKVSADFRNSYKQVSRYTEEGVLKSESTDLTKNLNRIVMDTSYDADILANGKMPSIENQSININGQVVRVVSTEHSNGVETSFYDGNVEQMRANAGNVQYVTRDENGSLIADNPELSDSLEKIGIENVDDIATACSEIDEKAEERDGEDIDEDMDFPDPVLR